VLIGYIRMKRGNDDTLPEQRQALQGAGCQRLVEDLAFEGRRDQPELRRLLDQLSTGDVVVVSQLDGLGQSMQDVVRVLQRIGAAGAGFRSLAEAVDTTTPTGHVAAVLINSLAAFDRSVTRDRIGAGLAVARAEGRVGGRRPKLTPAQRTMIADEVLSGRCTAADMARFYKVSEPTVSRLLAAHRAGARTPRADQPAGNDVRHIDRIAGVLPLSALGERIAIVGTSGSGKTYAAKGLVERLMDRGERVCIVDPLGVWWGLRAGADCIAASGYPVVVVSDLGSAAARRSFMTAFAEALYEANTEPLHLVLDEADLWAPQRSQHSGQALLGRIEEIVRRGRVRGFVPWLITQRPAVLHKDVLSQADILVSMKLTASQDREAIGRWIEGQADRAEGKRILAALPRLAQGEGYVWAPSDGVLAQVAFPRIRSFDSSRTPQRDERVAAPRTLVPLHSGFDRLAPEAARPGKLR